MDFSILKKIGLTGTQTKAYEALVTKGAMTPPLLAEAIGEKRSTVYMALEKMEKLGLVHSFTKNRKLTYRAQSPVSLKKFIENQRKAVIQREQLLDSSLPELLNNFYKHTEQPGVRFFQGKAGIKEIYMLQVQENQPIQFIRTRADLDFFGMTFMNEIRHMAPKAGIDRFTFSPDSPEVPINLEQSDRQWKLSRTFYEPQEYTAPVEWSVFGDKVSIISFGQEAMGMVIDSPQIAESLRQMFVMLDAGLRRKKDYDKFPTRAEYKDQTSHLEKYGEKTPRIT